MKSATQIAMAAKATANSKRGGRPIATVHIRASGSIVLLGKPFDISIPNFGEGVIGPLLRGCRFLEWPLKSKIFTLRVDTPCTFPPTPKPASSADPVPARRNCLKLPYAHGAAL